MLTLVALLDGLIIGTLVTVALWGLLAWLVLRWVGILPRNRPRS